MNSQKFEPFLKNLTPAARSQFRKMLTNILLPILILFGVIYICASESLWDGTYEKQLKPDKKEYTDFLMAMGYSKDLALNMIQSQVTIAIKVNTDKSFTIVTIGRQGNHSITIAPGNEFQDKLPDGRPFKATYIVEGNKIHGRRKYGDIEEIVEKEVTKEGITINRRVKDKTAIYLWKRISK